MRDEICILQFTKEEITTKLNINPNEKNNNRIIQYMENIFESKCYTKGRSKKIKFIAEVSIYMLDYIEFKLYFIREFKVKSSYNFENLLKLIRFSINNRTIVTLEELSDILKINLSDIKNIKHKFGSKLFHSQDYSKQQWYDNNHNEISLDLAEQIERTYNREIKNIELSNYKYDLLEVYYLDKDIYSNYEIISTNDKEYIRKKDNLMNNNYTLVEKGYLNSYLKNAIKKLHYKLYGFEFTYCRTNWTLIPKYMYNIEFKNLVNNAYKCKFN